MHWGLDVRVEFSAVDRSAGKSLAFTVDTEPGDSDDKRDENLPRRMRLAPFKFRWADEWKASPEQAYWGLSRVEPPIESPSPAPKFAEAFSAADLKSLPADTEALWLRGAKLTDADMGLLDRFPKLKRLEVREWPKTGFGPSMIACLEKYKTLEELGLYFEGIMDDHLEPLTKLPNLKQLSIPSEKLTDVGLEMLSTVNGLTLLGLYWCEGMTDKGMKRLSRLTELRTLELWGCKEMTDEGLESISKLTNLKRLRFGCTTNLSAKGFGYLKALKQLNHLTVGYVPLDDAGLAQLAGITSVEVVWIYNSDEITDKGIEVLKAWTKLSDLNLISCKKIRERGMRSLQAALPGKYHLDSHR